MNKEKNYISITNPSIGQKTAMLLFCLSSILIAFMSCARPEDIPDSYNVIINNQYFERVDSIFLDSCKFDGLDIGYEFTIPTNIAYGSHDLEIYTHSELKIQTTLMLIGTNSVVKLVINESGKVILTE